MGITIPKENKKVTFQPKAENNIIVPTRAKNYIVADSTEITALDVEPEQQTYRKIILGR